MTRTPRFSRAQILDAAFVLAAERGTGSLTVQGVAAAVGAPSGSLYHRYASRDHLLADLWLEAVEGFQREFARHLSEDDPSSAARAAARSVVLWSMREPDRASVLMLFRRTDLIGNGWPPEVQARAAQAGESLEQALSRFENRAGVVTTGPDSRKLRFCLIDAPYAVVRGALQRGQALTGADADLVDEIVAAILVTIEGVGLPRRRRNVGHSTTGCQG